MSIKKRIIERDLGEIDSKEERSTASVAAYRKRRAQKKLEAAEKDAPRKRKARTRRHPGKKRRPSRSMRKKPTRSSAARKQRIQKVKATARSTKSAPRKGGGY